MDGSQEKRPMYYEELSFGDLLLYIKAHIVEQFRKWYILAIFSVIGAVIGFAYAMISEPVYQAYSSFSTEKGSGTNTMLLSAMELAEQFGITAPGTGEEGSLTLEYLVGLAQSKRVVKSSLLHKESINGKVDHIANHYIKMYGLYEDETVHPNFRFSADSLLSMSMAEDSVMTMMYGMITDDHLTMAIPENFNMAVITMRTNNRELSRHLCENILEETEDFFINNRVKRDKEAIADMIRRSDSTGRMLYAAEYALADWNDSRNQIVKAKGSLPKLQLQRKVQVLTAISIELAKNLETARFSLMRNTPVIAIVDEPSFSMSVEKVSKKISLVVGLMVGFFLASVSIIISKVAGDAFEREQALNG